MREPDHVGALIRDERNRVYVQRRSPDRRLLPGAWDIVGGQIETGETITEALAREVTEETGWGLRRVESVIADWEWEYNGSIHREVDYLIEVDGNLRSPRLEVGKHDKYAWVDFRDVELIREGYESGNERLWNIIVKAARVRLTSRLRLEPINDSRAEDLWSVFKDGATVLDYADTLSREAVIQIAEDCGLRWEAGKGYNWLAYPRNSQYRPVGCVGLTAGPVSGEYRLAAGYASGLGTPSAAAADLIKAALAFARTELAASTVITSVAPVNPRAQDTLQRSGMRHTRSVDSSGYQCDLYEARFSEEFPFDLSQEVVTGIGQILAVRST